MLMTLHRKLEVSEFTSRYRRATQKLEK